MKTKGNFTIEIAGFGKENSTTLWIDSDIYEDQSNYSIEDFGMSKEEAEIALVMAQAQLDELVKKNNWIIKPVAHIVDNTIE